MRNGILTVIGAALGVCLAGCNGPAGAQGPAGPAGQDGAQGEKGEKGEPGPAGEGAAVSGTRLKARHRVADDGARAFEGWFDSELNTACSFAIAEDGEERCLPGVDASVLAKGAHVLFSDNACTVPILLVDAGCAAPSHAQLRPEAACGSIGVRVFATGAIISPPAPAYLLKTDGTCVTYGATGDFYALSEVDSVDFVAGVVVND